MAIDAHIPMYVIYKGGRSWGVLLEYVAVFVRGADRVCLDGWDYEEGFIRDFSQLGKGVLKKKVSRKVSRVTTKGLGILA